METCLITEISKIRAYQPYHAAAAKAMRPRLEKAMDDARLARQPVHREVVWYHDEHSFVCAIHANALQAKVIIYQLVVTEKFFQAIAYDPGSRLYYFFSNHLFEQYAARMHIQKKSHLGILHHYVRHNPFIAFMNSNPDEPPGKGFTAWIEAGVSFGAIRAANVNVFKTFITHDMLTPSQRRKYRKLQKRYIDATRVRMFGGR